MGKTTETKLNIYQKLLEIQKAVMGLGKDKDTKSQSNPSGYKYVTGDKVLGTIKPLMNEYGLILKQEVLSIENTRQDYSTKYGTKAEILSKAMMKFTWVDCETGEKDENLFGANGQNDWEKGLGSALTYAERYFLLKFFHIATDEDDIDNHERKTSEPIQTKVEQPKPQEKRHLLTGTESYDKAVMHLVQGTMNIPSMEKHYIITDEVKKKLLIDSTAKKLGA